jgi:hypothetical protein
MNVEHLGGFEGRLVLPRMDAINRTDVNAGAVLGPDARPTDDIGHF